MGLLDSLPANGAAAPAAAPAAPASGGLLGSLPANAGYKPAAPAAPLTPAGGGAPSPLTQGSLSIMHSLPASPAMTPPNQRYFPQPWATVDARGTSFGPSEEKDSSGLPYMSYRAPGATATTTDKTRVDTSFDPRVAMPLTQGSFTTPRAVANRAALKESMGGTSSTELDHVIALELAGSNDKSNLQIESSKDPNKPYSASNKTATDPLENKLAKEVIKGQKSLFDAQYELARAKGTAVPYVGDVAGKYMAAAYDAKKEADYMNSNIGLLEGTAGSIGNWAKSLGDVVMKGLSSSDTSPLPHWFQSIVDHPLQSAEGGVQYAVLQPIGFAAGIGDAIINKGINPLLGIHDDANNVYSQLSQMNTDLSETRTPEEQYSYGVGQFIGALVPYSATASGVNAAIDATKLAEYAPKIAPLFPFISNATSFLGTGQILHTPDEGSRLQQLKNDTTMLALFEAVPIFGRGIASALEKVGPSGILDTATKNAASDAMKPVVEDIKAGNPVTVDALDHAVTKASAIIEDATGKTPKELLQDHMEGKPSGMTEAKAREYVAKNYDQLKEKYAKQVEERYGTKNFVSADEAKEVIPGYNGKNAPEYHKASGDFRDRYYKELLDSEKGKGNNTVLFSSGATGVGKTSSMREAGIDVKKHPIIFDSNLNADTSPGKFHGAIDKGYNVQVTHTHRDPLESFAKGVVPRAESTGRAVTVAEHAHRHMAVPENLDTVHAQQEVHGRHRFVVTHIDNTGAKGEAKQIPIDKIPKFDYNAIHERLHEHLNRAESEGRISPENAHAIRGTSKSDHSGAGKNAEPKRAEGQSGKGGKEIKLPEFPDSGRPLLGVAFPGANYVARFIEKDIIERFGGARDAVTGIYKASKDLFTPNLGKEKAAAIVGSGLMKVEKYSSAAWKVAENRRDWWSHMTEKEHIDFLDLMERGQGTYDMFDRYPLGTQRTMADLAEEYRQRLDKAFDYESQAGAGEQRNYQDRYIQDYVPHYWTDPEGAAQFFKGVVDSMPQGKFTKVRTIDLIKEGLDAGFELRTTNPEELVLIREIDGQRVSAKIDMMRELQSEGLAVQIKSNDTAHANWPIVNGANGKQYAVTPDAKKILDNAFFEKSLWSQKGVMGTIFRSVMAVKGIVTPIKLSLSLFHPIHITFIDTSAERARVWEGIIKGNMPASEAMATLAKSTSLVSQVTDTWEYGNITKLWDKPMDQLSDREKTVVQYIIDGGGSPKMSEEFKIRASDGFKKALGDENYIGAAIRGLPKIIEAYQKPFFETYIPALKVASYIKDVEQAIKVKPELATNDVARKVALREMWKNTDSRFGMMVYKTKFWNPMLKEAGQAAFLSLGWNAGFVHAFGGGALDLVKLAGKGVLGKATLDDVTQRMLFSLDYSIQAALIGGIMTFAMTGKMPQGTQDLFFPNTGKTNPDGSPARLNTSFYTREYFSIVNHIQKEGIIGGTTSFARNKMSPVLNSLADVFNNKDFYGYQIHDTNENIPKQAEQVLKYLLENNLVPISATGAQNAVQTTGVLGEALSFAGFNPAPKYIAETGIQSQIYSVLDQRTGGTKPIDSKPAADAKTNIRKLYEAGNIDAANAALDAAVKAGYVTQTGRGTFIASLDLPADVRAFKSLAQYPSDQEHLLSQMSEEELARYADYASNAVKSHLSSLSPAAKKFVDDLQAGKIQLLQFKAGKDLQPTTP